MGMFGKVVLALLVSMAVLLPPNVLPAPTCCAQAESHQAALADGCCAGTPCCIISGDSARVPTTPASAASACATAPAPTTLVSLIVFPANPPWVRLAKAPPVAHSPPPLALLCTYLI